MKKLLNKKWLAVLISLVVLVALVINYAPISQAATQFFFPTGRTATYVIAASDATALEKAQADYISSGVAGSDDELLQSVINLIGNGVGEIVCIGTFNFNNMVSYTGTGNITIKGQGMGSYPETQTQGETVFVASTQPFAAADPMLGQGTMFSISPGSVNGSFSIKDCKIAMMDAAIQQISAIYIAGPNVTLSNILITNPHNGVLASTPAHQVRWNNVWVRAFAVDNDSSFAFMLQDQADFILDKCVAEGGNRGNGFIITSSNYGMMSDCRSDTCYAGVLFNGTSKYINVTGLTERAHVKQGLIISSPAHHITFNGGWLIDCSTAGYGGSNASTIYITGSNVAVLGMNIVDQQAVKTMKYGIYEDIGANNNSFIGNTITGASVQPILKTGSLTILTNNQGYIAPGEIRTYPGSLAPGVSTDPGNAIIAWQNPEAQAIMASVKTRITTGGTATSVGQMGWATVVAIVENCEDVWNITAPAGGATKANVAVNTVYVERGTNCIAITAAASIANADILAWEATGNMDLSTATHLQLKFRSNVALNAGDLSISLDQTTDFTSPIAWITLPAIAADTTTIVVLALNGGAAAGAGYNSVDSIGIRVNDITRFVSGKICYIDDIRAITVGATIFQAQDISPAAVPVVYDSLNATDAGTGDAKPVLVAAKNATDAASVHDTIVMVSVTEDSVGLAGSYYIQATGQ